ncbi:hypothetical protein J22TS1_11360 [Siminovitchia terrae]|nr:hypothetical protein J22TS1_11360 [Siminovitchia terrae]
MRRYLATKDDNCTIDFYRFGGGDPVHSKCILLMSLSPETSLFLIKLLFQGLYNKLVTGV